MRHAHYGKVAMKLEGMRKHHEQLKRIRKENTREKLKNAMQTGSV